MTPDEDVIVADQFTSMKAVLEELGWDIWKTPLQILCPVHKLGQESRPSARIYEDDRVIWCFYCVVQYRPTEVWAAQKQLDRPEAARELLSKWPVGEDAARAILRQAKLPYRPEQVDVYRGVLERHLLVYRGVAEFKRYQQWARAVDDFLVFIGTLSEESHETAIFSFTERLNASLSEKSFSDGTDS